MNPQDHQWHKIKKRRELSIGAKFPGFICAEDLLMLLRTFGIRLASVEARELLLIIVPGRNAWQNGRIEQKDLFNFATSSCRLFGILDSVLEKEVLSPLLTAYKEHREVIRVKGTADFALLDRYEAVLEEITRAVTTAYDSIETNNNPMLSVNASVDRNSTMSTAGGGASQQAAKPSNLRDLYSISQLKNGVEAAMM